MLPSADILMEFCLHFTNLNINYTKDFEQPLNFGCSFKQTMCFIFHSHTDSIVRNIKTV